VQTFFFNQTRCTIRNIFTVAGLRAPTELPGAFMREARPQARLWRAQLSRMRSG
jgi:hypothetical protein